MRIDDTDLSRSSDEYIQPIFDTFNWLGLDIDEVHYQSRRKSVYLDYANALLANGHAQLEHNGAISLVRPLDMPSVWHDEVIGDVKITDSDLDQVSGLILIKADGMPTYNFASAIDDYKLGINYIIRGSDHISNTAKQISVWAALGVKLPMFAHVGLIHFQKKKLSKRDGAASMLHYMNAGYDPDAVLNFMLRLGWGPTVDDKTTKIINKERALELFITGGNMRSASSNMDLNILEAYDRKYKAQKNVWRTRDKLLNDNTSYAQQQTMTELTPNHLLNLDDIVGLQYVDKTSKHEPGVISYEELVVLAKRAGYTRVGVITKHSLITADYDTTRLRIMINDDKIIVKYYSS
ncbi:MAG: hypothetical protein HC836_23230 [Richelia sp. RM2_1_2]|nr:hypothetical protein [Richelia sp. RM2_1_2]